MKSSTERTSTKNKAVLLFGPTASGKTALTKTLFSEGAEIINADSVQVYRYLDIGSAKPEDELRDLIPHHLIDIRNPWEQYTAGDFVRDAEAAIEEISSRGKLPVITGGEDPETADLSAAASAYLIEHGMSEEALDTLLSKLTD